jgi:transcriptional regulator with XRE-family HTH domain
MTNGTRQSELGRFLRDRRARVQPADVGLPSGPHRRVTGLRREEVATLAGVGVSWYTMLENGTATGVSPATLSAIANALHLSTDETEYLLQLTDDRTTTAPFAQPGRITQGALDAIVWAPAYVCTLQWMVLAWNRAMALVWGIGEPGGAPFNIVVRMFRDPALRAMHGDGFEAFAHALVAMVRAGAGRRIDDPAYQRIYDELHDDAVFRAAWDAYGIATPLGSFPTLVNSAAIGPFAYEALTLMVPDDGGHAIIIQVPDDASAARLRAALGS